jgi:hypothetical protein
MKSLQHQIAYVLSVNVITRDDNDITLKQFPLVQLTKPLLMIWAIKRWVSSIRYQLHTLKLKVKHPVIVTGKLLSIGFNSLAWGIAL